MIRIQSWKKFTNRGNLVKPVSARFLSRLWDILGVKVLWEHDWLDAAWGRVLGLATNAIKHKSTCRNIRVDQLKNSQLPLQMAFSISICALTHLTKVVQDVSDEHKLAGVELDHRYIGEELRTLCVNKGCSC